MALRIPATIISGFLGAGKTSLLTHILAQAGDRQIALIINEFGDVGVDRELLMGCNMPNCGDQDVIELANGCICCTVADDFLPAMHTLLARDPGPDHILIETSGLALPKPLIKAFTWPDIRTRVSVDGVLTMVDAPALQAGLFASNPVELDRLRQNDPTIDHETPLSELFHDQLAAADLVIVNKCDLVEEAALEALKHQLQARLRPGVRMVSSQFGKLPITIALGLSARAEDDLASRPSHHDADEDHDHDDFESFIVELPELADPQIFLQKLDAVIHDHTILRVKGFMAYRAKPMRAVVQAVGARIQHYFDRPWGKDEVRKSHLVVIGEHGLDVARIRAALNAITSKYDDGGQSGIAD
ncbi:MAG: cobalamin biosynthesis protein CobW [Pseudomonadota bacterium]